MLMCKQAFKGINYKFGAQIANTLLTPAFTFKKHYCPTFAAI